MAYEGIYKAIVVLAMVLAMTFYFFLKVVRDLCSILVNVVYAKLLCSL